MSAFFRKYWLYATLWLSVAMFLLPLWFLVNYGRISTLEINNTLSLGMASFDSDLYRRIGYWTLGLPTLLTLILVLFSWLSQRLNPLILIIPIAAGPTVAALFGWNLLITPPPQGDGRTAWQYYSNPTDPPMAGKNKSLIWIYSESLESDYREKRILKRLQDSTPDFVEFSVAPLINQNTIGGIMSARCSAPLVLPSIFNTNSRVESPFAKANCIDDRIRRQNYFSELIIGHDPKFGGLESYFLRHGHARISQLPELAQAGIFPSEKHGHVHDEDLLRYALKRIQTLLQQQQPFSVTVVTLDNHAPAGFPSQRCLKEYGNALPDVLQCNNDALASFMVNLRKMGALEKAVIVVQGDHLFMGDFPETPENKIRHIFTRLYSGDGTRALKSTNITPFDLAPTIMDALGFSVGSSQIGFGVSAYSELSIHKQEWLDMLQAGFSAPVPESYMSLHR